MTNIGRMPDAEIPQLDRIAANLPTIFPGAVVVDRGLELGRTGSRVDLAAVDGEGRLLLVAEVTGEGADPVLLTLDALAFARRNLSLFAHHFQNPALSAELDPMVVLVADTFSPALLDRLGGIDPSLVACLELRELVSRERRETYLVPVVPGTGAEARRGGSRPGDFLQFLGPDLRGVGELLLERLVRIDDELAATSSGRQMRFALGGEPICVLTAEHDALEARVAPDGGTFRVTTRADVDAFLEDVLGRTLELFEPRGRGSRLAPIEVSEPAAGPQAPATGPGPSDPGSLREAALDPRMPSGAILTPEEIEAFRSMK